MLPRRPSSPVDDASMYIFNVLRSVCRDERSSADIRDAAGNHGVIRVRAKTVAGESWQPKTKKNRGVPVSSRLRPYLDKLKLKGLPGPWLFPNSQGGRYDPDNFSSDLRALNAAKCLQWTNLDYRHTFGSQLAMKGESLYKIATLMGNSPEICRRHYAALMPESLTDSVEFPEPALAPQQSQVASA